MHCRCVFDGDVDVLDGVCIAGSKDEVEFNACWAHVFFFHFYYTLNFKTESSNANVCHENLF